MKAKKDIKELISDPFGNQDTWRGCKLWAAPTIVTISEIILEKLFGQNAWL